MEFTLIVSSVYPLKKFRCPYLREERGVKQDAKMSIFLCPYYRGGEGSRQINQMSLNNIFIFLDGFPFSIFINGI